MWNNITQIFKFPVLMMAISLFFTKLLFSGPYSVPDAPTFFSNIDTSYPGLEEVKQAVNEGNYDLAKEKYAEFVKNRSDRKYFFDWRKREKIIEAYPKYYPDEATSTILLSDCICKHLLPWSGGYYQLEEDIDWTKEPPYSWLNRMYFWRDLAKAYWLTKNPEYAREWVSEVNDWLADAPVPENPPGWKGEPPLWHSLDAGKRIENWLEAYYFFLGVPEFDTNSQFNLIRGLMEHGKYLYAKHYSMYQEGNFQLVECGMLTVLAVMFPEFKDSSSWISIAVQRLEEHMSSETNEDGFTIESPGYHCGASLQEGYFRAVRIEQVNNLSLFSPTFHTTFQKMFEVIKRMLKPNGFAPVIGDGWGDFSNVFVIGSFLYNRADFRYLSPAIIPSSLLTILGEDALEEFSGLPREEVTLSSDSLPYTNYYMMRSGKGMSEIPTTENSYNSLYLLFDLREHLGHGHNNALNIIISGYEDHALYSKELLIDPAIGWGYADPRYSTYFTNSRAHNIVQIDKKEQPLGSVTPTLNLWITNNGYDYASGSFGPYEGVTQTRDIFFVKGEYWILRDKLIGAGTHLLEQLFHLQPMLKEVFSHNPFLGSTTKTWESIYNLGIDTQTKIVCTNYDGANLKLIPANPSDLSLSIDTGWLSIDYPRHIWETREDKPAPIVIYSKNTSTASPGVIFETILYPLHAGENKKITVDRLSLSGGSTNPVINSGLKINISKKNSQDLEKIDYYLVNGEGNTLTYASSIIFNGENALVRTIFTPRIIGQEYKKDFFPYLICLIKGKSLSYDKYVIIPDTSTNLYLERTSPNNYEFYTNSQTTVTLPYENLRDIINLSIYYRTLGKGDWIKVNSSINSVQGTITTKIPCTGLLELIISTPDSISSLNSLEVQCNPRIFTPNADGINDCAIISVNNPTSEELKGTIFDLSGCLIRNSLPQISNTFTWDGKDNEGRLMNTGIYIYQIKNGNKFINGSIVLAY